jgi:YidC/Oxa1 family membrane protein insertase
MQLLQPKLEKLKKSFANNPQRLQEEQQKLYQQEGVNPMGSCLPMFIQMFLLFGVIDVIYKPITHILDISKNVIKEAVTIAHTATGDKSLDMSNLRCEL